jgi:hypothetical protein
MFRPGETICVSHNQFGYHSIPLENAMNGPVVLVPTQDSLDKRKITLEQGIERMESIQMILCALNPIRGFREDLNCTAFRNFLVEVDYGPLPEQLAYVRKIGLPYSACIFSGNKSLHFLVSLDTDLPSENVYRHFSEWILNIVSLADNKTKNPSRSIRLPGAWREPKKLQRLVEIRGQTPIKDLVKWLNEHPDAKPIQSAKREISGEPNFYKIKPWVHSVLHNGIDPRKGRNQQWFSIACEFAVCGYSEDDTILKLEGFFVEDRDFKRKEWLTAIRSGFKYVYDRK